MAILSLIYQFNAKQGIVYLIKKKTVIKEKLFDNYTWFQLNSYLKAKREGRGCSKYESRGKFWQP